MTSSRSPSALPVLLLPLVVLLSAVPRLPAAPPADATEDQRFTEPLDVEPRPISTDANVRYDYDIVYVRARRAGDEVHKRYYTDIATPVYLEPGADLMLLRPDGSEDLLVEGGEGAVTDPMVSFDGEWVYYTLIHTLEGANAWQPPVRGADIFKMHLPSRRTVRLTDQRFTPNTGAADWSSDSRAAPEAIEGKYAGPGGELVRAEPLSDEDRFTLVRWIDLGCPIDLDREPPRPGGRGYGWMCDDNRPVLTLTTPRPGAIEPFSRILIGMYDDGTGLDSTSFEVKADFPAAGAAPGENIAPRFAPLSEGVWELKLPEPIASLEKGKLVVSVRDRQGNVSRIERTFSVGR
ncbi:MAG TPA: hypothetical protein VMT52_17425 [Planctomycetota bacterium]|nr:hypothetical protein [Planctomycetota bacterium]